MLLPLLPSCFWISSNMSFRSFIHLLLLAVALSLAQSTHALPSLLRRATLKGIDVSDFTTGVNFNSVKANGVSFVYIKATEGTSTRTPFSYFLCG